MTYKEKQALLEWAHRYVQSNKPNLTLGQYQRVMSWLNGMSFKEIAEEEGVSTQAVAQSVKRDLDKIRVFAKFNDK